MYNILIMTNVTTVAKLSTQCEQNKQHKLLPCLLLLLLCLDPCKKAACRSSGPGGKAFADTITVYKMDDEWLKKPIQYAPADKGADLVITLEQNFSQPLTPLINAYAKKYNLNIIVKNGTCEISAGKTRKKSVDISALCCPPRTTDRLPGLNFHTIGIGAIALIVHNNNPVDNITFTEAQQIFSGDIQNSVTMN